MRELLQRSDFSSEGIGGGLADLSSSASALTPSNTPDALSGFLQTYLLRVLMNVNNTFADNQSLNHRSILVVEHAKMIQSLTAVIGLIGQKVHLTMAQVLYWNKL